MRKPLVTRGGFTHGRGPFRCNGIDRVISYDPPRQEGDRNHQRDHRAGRGGFRGGFQ